MNDINRYALENNHFFETKKKIVLAGESRIFNNWKEHSTITREEFLEALEWVCSDPLKEDGRMTREIGLTPTRIIGSFANVGVGENNAVSGRIKCVQHSEKFS